MCIRPQYPIPITHKMISKDSVFVNILPSYWPIMPDSLVFPIPSTKTGISAKVLDRYENTVESKCKQDDKHGIYFVQMIYKFVHVKFRENKSMGNNCKNKKNIWHKCRKYVVQILRLAGGVIHLSNLNGWTIPYYKSLPGSHLTIAKITHISTKYFSFWQIRISTRYFSYL